jgi:hypothetical protein
LLHPSEIFGGLSDHSRQLALISTWQISRLNS